MSEPNTPPPLIGAQGNQNNENKDVTDDSGKDANVTDTEAGQVAVEEAPDRRTEPYGESSVGISVTNVSDEDKPKAEPEATAFNTKRADSDTPTDDKGPRTWGHELHAVVDPFEDGPGSPFDKGDYVGTDPYRAVDSDVRTASPVVADED